MWGYMNLRKRGLPLREITPDEFDDYIDCDHVCQVGYKVAGCLATIKLAGIWYFFISSYTPRIFCSSIMISDVFRIVKPNISRLSEMLGGNMNMDEVKKQLDLKVKALVTKYKNDFKSDLIPLISETDFISIYVDNYHEEYLRFKSQVFK